MGRELLRTYPLQWLLGRATEKDKRREVRAPSFILSKYNEIKQTLEYHDDVRHYDWLCCSIIFLWR